MNSTWSNSAVNKDKCNKIREPNQIASKKINSKFYYLNFEPEKKKNICCSKCQRNKISALQLGEY